jgi:hypothetical protein
MGRTCNPQLIKKQEALEPEPSGMPNNWENAIMLSANNLIVIVMTTVTN